MLIVDTHCHALPHWFEPVEVLLHQMHAASPGPWSTSSAAVTTTKRWVFGKTATSLFKFAG